MRELIEAAYDDRALLKDPQVVAAIHAAMDALECGEIRVAENVDGEWVVHAWVKKAILLYFAVSPMQVTHAGDFSFYDKIPVRTDLDRQGVRVVPHAMVRRGAFVAKGAVLMPSYVNIGAYVGGGTMVDTWATVGSCAQIGNHVHLSGGVGIGGVLEPPQGQPVIIEDECFVGSRCIVVEGVRVGRRAVLGANVVLTGSTRIIDVTGAVPVVTRGHVPAGSVVIPGVAPKQFPAGEFQVPAALIIGRRTEQTDTKTSLNQALRDFEVAV